MPGCNLWKKRCTANSATSCWLIMQYVKTFLGSSAGRQTAIIGHLLCLWSWPAANLRLTSDQTFVADFCCATWLLGLLLHVLHTMLQSCNKLHNKGPKMTLLYFCATCCGKAEHWFVKPCLFTYLNSVTSLWTCGKVLKTIIYKYFT